MNINVIHIFVKYKINEMISVIEKAVQFIFHSSIKI